MSSSLRATSIAAAAFLDADAAAREWALVAPVMSGEVFPGRMRVADSRGAYGWKRRKPLTTTPPTAPTAVELFDTATGHARVVAVDIDAAAVGPRYAAAHAASIATLFREVGLHPWVDASASGGRHVVAKLPHTVPQPALKAVVAGLAQLYPSVDTAPVAGIHGCLRPTGSRHKSGGWQRHTGTFDELHAAVTAAPATDAWTRLQAAVPAVEDVAAEVPAQRELPGTRLPAEAIGDVLHRQAVQGPTKAVHMADQSRFRYRVERTAVEAGFTQDEYVDAVMTQWTWMKRSYARKGHPAKVAADHYGYALRKPRKKHRPEAPRKSYSRNLDTSQPNYPHPPPIPADLTARKWLTHARRSARAHALTAHERWLVVVLAGFSLSKRSLQLDAGLRAYALGCGLSHENVRSGLIRLAGLGLIRKVGDARARKADVWELVADRVHDETPAPGWIQGLRTPFMELGPMAGEIYELLVTHGNPARGRRRRKRPNGKGIPHSAALSTNEIALLTGYSPSAVKDALTVLRAWDLAKHVPKGATRAAGWIGGAANPDEVAAILGTDELFELRRQTYARQRARWWAWLDGYRTGSTHEPTMPLFDLDIAATAPPDDSWLDDLVDIPHSSRSRADPSAAG